MAAQNNFKNATRRLKRIVRGIWRIPETQRQLSELADQATKLSDQATKHENLLQSVPLALRDLSNRLEFVRRELMFEMRYGTRSQRLGVDSSLNIEPRIISNEKVITARKNALRLNLGCGHVPLSEYINIDRRELPDVDVIADVSALPFEKGEVDEVFSAHVLEHFPQEQLRRELLPYWKSLLKPGGIFRAVVPDAEFMIREYCNNNYPYAHLREVTFGSQDYDGDFHFNMFSHGQLSELLTEAGFSNVQFEAEGRPNGICFEMAVIAKNGTP